MARSFNLRNCAIEIFLKEGKSYFFNLYDHQAQKKIIKLIRNQYKDNIGSKVSKIFCSNRKQGFEQSQLMKQWQNGKISNFEYLSKLNFYAGRTFNDINQYPVFPWIISDYDSQELDLSNEIHYRDLEKPIGALNEARYEFFEERYKSLIQDSPDIKPFLYGTHYSSMAPVNYFLVRMEPFTSKCRDLQQGSFDSPDRLFNYVSNAWKSSQTNTSDVMEILPEFYYLPNFFRNENNLDLGYTSDPTKSKEENKVDNVKLPPWAKSPEEYVFINREALESEYVSENLHKWIDLIFGYKQNGENAIKYKNLFFHLTYEMEVEKILQNKPKIEEQASLVDQISNFGQTPHQIIFQPHPTKKTKFYKPQKLFQNVSEDNSCQLLGHNDNFSQNMTILGIKKINDYTRIQTQSNIILYVNSSNENNDKNFKLDLGKVIVNEYNWQAQICHIDGQINSNMLISAGYPDGTFKIFKDFQETTQDNQLESFFTQGVHMQVITCVRFCPHNYYIICGSKDCKISLWKLNKQTLKLQKKVKHIIYGHHNQITALNISSELSIIVSADFDGVVMIHSIRSARYLFSFQINDQLQKKDETICQISIHDNGLILISSNYNQIFLYNLNGRLLNKMNMPLNQKEKPLKISQIQFVNNFTSDFLLSTNEGYIQLFDGFKMKLKRDYFQDFDKLKKNKSNLVDNQGKILNEDLYFDIALNDYNDQKDDKIIICYEKGKYTEIVAIDPNEHIKKLKYLAMI